MNVFEIEFFIHFLKGIHNYFHQIVTNSSGLKVLKRTLISSLSSGTGKNSELLHTRASSTKWSPETGVFSGAPRESSACAFGSSEHPGQFWNAHDNRGSRSVESKRCLRSPKCSRSGGSVEHLRWWTSACWPAARKRLSRLCIRAGFVCAFKRPSKSIGFSLPSNVINNHFGQHTGIRWQRWIVVSRNGVSKNYLSKPSCKYNDDGKRKRHQQNTTHYLQGDSYELLETENK